MNKVLPENWKNTAKVKKHAYSQLLKNNKTKKWIKRLPDEHEEIFSKINCLDCAACCKNISPRFKVPDIERISKSLKMKQSDFIEKYLNVDHEGDFVAKTAPCPFLGVDNFCSIYDVRPRDCKNYPYTDTDFFLKYPTTTIQNSTLCPAAFLLLEKMLDESNK